MPLDDRIDHETGQVKVKLPIIHFPHDGKPDGEHVWCTPAGPEHYVIDNVPWFADAYHYKDTIEARMTPSGMTCPCCPREWLEAKRLCIRSGYETVLWAFATKLTDAEVYKHLDYLTEQAGTNTEGADNLHMATAVPPGRMDDFERAIAHLEAIGVVEKDEEGE